MTTGAVGAVGPFLDRRGRIVALVGALWSAGAAAYLTATAVDVNTPSLLQNASARRGDLGYAALALLVALLAALVAWRRRDPGAVVGMALAVAAVGFAALATEAVRLSDHEFILPTLVLAVWFPAALLVDGGCLIGAARSREALVGTLALVIGLTGVLAATVFVDKTDEAVVAAGLHDHWEQETAVDNVFVDAAGNVWGVRPWEQTEPATIFLRDAASGEFRETAERTPAWPPAVLGSDAGGTTWIAFSELEDPFQPVFETYKDGQFASVPAPPTPLPPLDALALDRSGGRVFGLHSDFAVPATLVLEVFEAGQWRSVPTPLVAPGRATSADMAVDAAGRVWVWHDADPATIHRYDGVTWTATPLPFDLETASDLDDPPIAMDAFRTFFADTNGALWLFDRDGSQLIAIDETGASGLRPLPPGCAPLAFDPTGRVWCGDDEGLVVAAPDGTVLYESREHDVHPFTPESVAIGPDRAWVLARRAGTNQLLTFDYPGALPAA